jgi:hypothetical protein
MKKENNNFPKVGTKAIEEDGELRYKWPKEPLVKEPSLLKRKLTPEEREELLEKFDLYTEDGVIYDDDGKRFYANPKNKYYKLNNLIDFFEYAAHIARVQGRNDLRRELKGILKDENPTNNLVID